MQFEISKEILSQACKKIREVKFFNAKEKEPVFSSMLIEVLDSDRNPPISFLTTDSISWALVKIKSQDGLKVKSSGSCFVEAAKFLDLVDSYPADAEITISIGENKKKESASISLSCQTKGRKKKTSFPLRNIPDHVFERQPNTEYTQRVDILASDLSEAVDYTEYASGTEDNESYLWGCKLDFYKNEETNTTEVVSAASDHKRISWYDRKGIERSGASICGCTPIKSKLVSASRALEQKENVKIGIGDKHTIFEQNGLTLIIPNVQDSSGFPEWRNVVEKHSKDLISTVKIPRDTFDSCLKSATSIVGEEYGLQIDMDEEKNLVLSVNRIDVSGNFGSTHEETEKISDEQIIGEYSPAHVCVGINYLKEFMDKVGKKNEFVLFKIGSPVTPVQMFVPGNTHTSCLVGSVPPIETNEESVELEEVEPES